MNTASQSDTPLTDALDLLNGHYSDARHVFIKPYAELSRRLEIDLKEKQHVLDKYNSWHTEYLGDPLRHPSRSEAIEQRDAALAHLALERQNTELAKDKARLDKLENFYLNSDSDSWFRFLNEVEASGFRRVIDDAILRQPAPKEQKL